MTEKMTIEMMEIDELLDIAQEPGSTCGVYVLLDGEEVVYVGQSGTMATRIENHIQGGLKIFDRFAIIPCSPADLTVTEAAYIRKYQPRYNRKGLQ